MDDTIESLYLSMQKVLADTHRDLDKALVGNKAAGTRVRKTMQDIKKLAQQIRGKVLDAQKTTT